MFDCNGLFGSTAGEAAFLAKQGILAACVNMFLAKLYLFCRCLPQVIYGWQDLVIDDRLKTVQH